MTLSVEQRLDWLEVRIGELCSWVDREWVDLDDWRFDGAPLATWMLKGFFDGIPTELDDAAMIDGATRFTAFRRVILPIALPSLSAVFVIAALLAWAEFVVPFILLSDPSNLPISVGILNFQGNYATNSTGVLAAGSVLAVAPAILLFVALQRYIVGAFVAGALKG